ncbi:Signal transduction histidine kinase [Chryseolinea serpens]|uniref:histidine kinase n=1 Tax=Chryseolinea serpens TaxID=947013 RepID=A0A1M5QT17_9BACT|nr:response regulator [Chryseolinea serpens]SHH17222.1 Signal transduction histidine kinase [Chryseolinea serpens]
MTLDKKIQAGFIGCSLVLLVIAMISFRNSEKFVDTNQWVNHTHEVLYEFDQVLISSVNAETGARGFVIANDESYLERFNAAKAALFEHIKKVRELTRDNPGQQKNIDDIERLAIAHVNHLDRKIEARREDFEKARQMVVGGEGKRIEDEIRKGIEHAKGVEQALLVERKQASENDAKNFNIIFIALLLVIVGVLVVVYFIISTNLEALRKAETETAHKNWSLTGSADLVKKMQGNKRVDELSEVIINHLAVYLNAHIGAFYLVENGDTHLRLTGWHAINKTKREHPVVEFGEGLVGQAAAERSVKEVTHIAPGYFHMHTGFGETAPKNIIAMPFVFENAVVGVIELGSLHEFDDLKKQYLGLVADSIAIAVTSSQAREKTKELLEETQRQAEELTVQQEELRQSNDELHAKTEQLERSEGELKKQQEELRQANEELGEKADLLEYQKEKLEDAKTEIEIKAREIEVTSKYKSEFLANMSHELRTPLNSILILAQLLAENRSDVLGKKEVEYARNIHNSGTDLLNLINEILDLSKVEAGKMELDISEVNLQGIAGNMSALFSELAKEKSIEFTIDVNEDTLPVVLKTDKQRVEQVLKNLLSNAFKFTPGGGKVGLSIGRVSKDAGSGSRFLSGIDQIAFSVTDTGIGITRDKQGVIFEAFQQADGSTKRKYGGTGLGLSISRELVHVLGGKIQLESEEGRGSTFTMYLPLQFDPALIVSDNKQIEIKEKRSPRIEKAVKPEEMPLDDTQATDDRNHIRENDKVILIIEDEAPFANVLLDFVRERKYKGIIARQGNTGISYARHFKPDAILLDMKLPVMDGDEVLKLIKNDPDLRHIPIQIISAHDKKKEGLELGAFDYIKKPVTPQELRKAFDRIENFAGKKTKKLLIIEDNEQHNNAIRELIGNGDVTCFSAYEGAKAYKMMEEEAFDCVIVDLGLPDMSGFELLEKIKGNDNLNKIPVVVYTGRDLKKEESARLDRLANTVVLKTADSKERLLDETILFLHRVESRLPKEKQTIIRKLHKSDEVLKNKRILLVDDDIRNIYSLTNALEEEGLLCTTAENGRVAVEMLSSNGSFDLVLMDIMMPEMDGYEATAAIRKIPKFDKLPIIALTAKAMKGDKEKCLAVGMSDYISKPVNIGQLLSLMRVWLYR